MNLNETVFSVFSFWQKTLCPLPIVLPCHCPCEKTWIDSKDLCKGRTLSSWEMPWLRTDGVRIPPWSGGIISRVSRQRELQTGIFSLVCRRHWCPRLVTGQFPEHPWYSQERTIRERQKGRLLPSVFLGGLQVQEVTKRPLVLSFQLSPVSPSGLKDDLSRMLGF